MAKGLPKKVQRPHPRGSLRSPDRGPVLQSQTFFLDKSQLDQAGDPPLRTTQSDRAVRIREGCQGEPDRLHIRDPNNLQPFDHLLVSCRHQHH
ncbi:MAG: hypothetical protein WDM88_09210, partial [Galbitalea sp.]